MVLKTVNENRIYETILNLEGPRHPITSMERLNFTADYIINALKGIDVEIQTFELKGFQGEFRNIIATIGDKNQEGILLSSHYDSVELSPGANDNLSAVAVVLETAKILMEMDSPPTVHFAFFTLEEGNPVIKNVLNNELIEAGILNTNLKYTSFDLLEASKTFFKKTKKLFSKLYAPIQVYETLIKDGLTSQELRIAKAYLKTFQSFPEYDENTLPVIGSSVFVDALDELDIKVKCVINYDCLGWIKDEKGTQKPLPFPDKYHKFFNEYKANQKDGIGNFMGVFGDVHSSNYLKSFTHCMKEVDIPHLSMDVPLNHNDMKRLMPDLLRSDHRPFWNKNIPGLFISDLANFRSELYHTKADESQYINYDMLKKITQATLKFILDN